MDVVAARIAGARGAHQVTGFKLLSLAIDPTGARIRIDVGLDEMNLDAAAFAATIVRTLTPMLVDGIRSIRIDMYRGAFDRIGEPMRLVATASAVADPTARFAQASAETERTQLPRLAGFAAPRLG